MREEDNSTWEKIKPCDRKCKSDRNMQVPRENYEMYSDLNKY